MASAAASKSVVRRRMIKVVVSGSGQRVAQSMEVDVVPMMAPVDHTLRYYEPEESFYTISIPKLYNMG